MATTKTINKTSPKQSAQAEKAPGWYKVFLLNDDFTPMDFVVDVLQRFFALERAQAERIMWQVHKQGKGICGIYPRDLAETKAAQVNRYARQCEHPLLCGIEPEN